MQRLLCFGVLGVLLAGATPACYVQPAAPPPTVVARRGPPQCAQAVWIEGHFEPHGRWVPPHWRCVRAAY
jgi:hypothetical protein